MTKTQEFNNEVGRVQREKGLQRPAAVKAVIAAKPDLYRAMMQEANPRASEEQLDSLVERA